MPTVATQTTGYYDHVDDDNNIEVLNTMRTMTSKFTDELICIFFKHTRSTSNDKNTMTVYNSLNDKFMDKRSVVLPVEELLY